MDSEVWLEVDNGDIRQKNEIREEEQRGTLMYTYLVPICKCKL